MPKVDDHEAYSLCMKGGLADKRIVGDSTEDESRDTSRPIAVLNQTCAWEIPAHRDPIVWLTQPELSRGNPYYTLKDLYV